MRPSEQYVKACNPDRWTILGRKLRDFTPAHAELLDRLGYNAADISPEILLTAIRVCSLRRKKAAKYLEKGGRTLWQFGALLLFKLKPEAFRQSAEAFQAYLDAANETPAFWADEKATRVATCPALLMLKRDLMNHYGYTADQVLAMPLAKAEWERLAILEAQGALDFKTDEDNDVIKQAEAMAREYAANGGKWL